MGCLPGGGEVAGHALGPTGDGSVVVVVAEVPRVAGEDEATAAPAADPGFVVDPLLPVGAESLVFGAVPALLSGAAGLLVGAGACGAAALPAGDQGA